MTDGVFTLDVAAIENGFADDCARKLLEEWRLSGGFLNDGLLPLSPSLVIMNGRQAPQEAPEILLAGNDALASKILGKGWARRPARETMDEKYRCLIGEAYQRATLNRQPVFDLVSTTLHAYGQSTHLRYHRVIVPLETMYGAPFLACYSFAAGPDLPEAPVKPGDEFPLRQETQTPGHAGPSAPADFPMPGRF